MPHTPQEEIEVKFFDLDLGEIRKKLQNLDATIKTPERLMRRKVYGGEANDSMTCTYGRVRDEGDIITMSAKYSAVKGEITSQKEIQVTVDNFESAAALLEAFGLNPTDYQENKRETWQLPDGTLVELEQWPDLHHYIEIEGKSVDNIKAVAAELGLEWATHTTDSTDKLYLKYLSAPEDEVRKKLKDLRF